MLDKIQSESSLGAVAGQDDSSQANISPAKLLDAAKQFESLMLSEMLKSMREASGDGWLGTGDDAAGDSAMALAQEQFAQALAQNGGLGLSKMVAQGLERAKR
jgi:Rod binding domain-containing protein